MNGFFAKKYFLKKYSFGKTFFFSTNMNHRWLSEECFNKGTLYDWQQGIPAKKVLFASKEDAEIQKSQDFDSGIIQIVEE